MHSFFGSSTVAANDGLFSSGSAFSWGSVTEARWGGVPRVYIQTLKDRTVSPALQKRLYEASPVEKVLDLDAGHLPFLSQPEALSKLLLSL